MTTSAERVIRCVSVRQTGSPNKPVPASTETRVAAVFLFAIIEFTLIIVPLILLTLRPGAAATVIERSQDWLKRHGRRLSAYVALVLGAYLTISSLVSLLG
jgi:Sap-like sulfolipid-1-addressing protein